MGPRARPSLQRRTWTPTRRNRSAIRHRKWPIWSASRGVVIGKRLNELTGVITDVPHPDIAPKEYAACSPRRR